MHAKLSQVLRRRQLSLWSLCSGNYLNGTRPCDGETGPSLKQKGPQNVDSQTERGWGLSPLSRLSCANFPSSSLCLFDWKKSPPVQWWPATYFPRTKAIHIPAFRINMGSLSFARDLRYKNDRQFLLRKKFSELPLQSPHSAWIKFYMRGLENAHGKCTWI